MFLTKDIQYSIKETLEIDISLCKRRFTFTKLVYKDIVNTSNILFVVFEKGVHYNILLSLLVPHCNGIYLYNTSYTVFVTYIKMYRQQHIKLNIQILQRRYSNKIL